MPMRPFQPMHSSNGSSWHLRSPFKQVFYGSTLQRRRLLSYLEVKTCTSCTAILKVSSKNTFLSSFRSRYLRCSKASWTNTFLLWIIHVLSLYHQSIQYVVPLNYHTPLSPPASEVVSSTLEIRTCMSFSCTINLRSSKASYRHGSSPPRHIYVPRKNPTALRFKGFELAVH